VRLGDSVGGSRKRRSACETKVDLRVFPEEADYARPFPFELALVHVLLLFYILLAGLCHFSSVAISSYRYHATKPACFRNLLHFLQSTLAILFQYMLWNIIFEV